MNNRIEELFEMLGEGLQFTEVAASELLLHPDWLVGKPPSQLIMALKTIGYDSQSSVFQLARQWESLAISESLLEIFFDENHAKSKEHSAWLVKHIAGPARLEVLKRIALSEEESAAVRRLFLEALDRLAFARQIGLVETNGIINALKNAPDPGIREGIVGILMSLEDSTEKLSILMDMLADSSDFVAASAANAISQMKNVHLDKSFLNNLLSHPSLLVRERVKKMLRD